MFIRASLAAGALALVFAVPASAQYAAPAAPAALPPAAAAPPPATAAAMPVGQTTQAVTDLNLRAGPGMEFPPIAVIPGGTPVQVHACLEGSVWCEVTFGGMTGFASDRFLGAGMIGEAAFAAEPVAAPRPAVTAEPRMLAQPAYAAEPVLAVRN